MMTTKTFMHIPYALAHDEGERVYVFGALRVVVKADSQQTGGAFNLFEVTCPPDFVTSLDIHYAEDVAVYVLEGTLTFFWGSEEQQAAAGSYFYQPRGIPHGFRVEGSTPARILYLTVPGGLDGFLAAQGTLFPHCSECVTAAARHKIEILGALLQ
jgi:quercetin dioxygenase-like cupin family protein